jgi:hypothetical protein
MDNYTLSVIQSPLIGIKLNMDFKIDISENGKYIIVKVYTEVTKALMQSIALQADAAGIKHNITNLLIDLRDSKTKSYFKPRVKFSQTELPNPHDAYYKKIAVLVKHNDYTHNLILILIRHKGFNIYMFKEENDAVQWIERQV